MRHWEEYLPRLPVRHLSLHFDGVRVDEDRVRASHGTIEEFSKEAARHIAEQTGIVVTIEAKTHRSLQEVMQTECTWGDEQLVGDIDNLTDLLKDCNCIPLALWYSGDSQFRSRVCAVFLASGGANTSALSLGGRTYKQCCGMVNEDGGTHLTMTPYLGFDPRQAGNYLLHSENRGRPHCVLIVVPDDLSCDIYSRGKSKTTCIYTAQLVQCYTCEAVDHALDVTYALSFGPEATDSPYEDEDVAVVAQELLYLLAGAGHDEEANINLADEQLEAHVLHEDDSNANGSEGAVLVKAALLDSVKKEISTWRAQQQHQMSSKAPTRCMFCPFSAASIRSPSALCMWISTTSGKRPTLHPGQNRQQ